MHVNGAGHATLDQERHEACMPCSRPQCSPAKKRVGGHQWLVHFSATPRTSGHTKDSPSREQGACCRGATKQLGQRTHWASSPFPGPAFLLLAVPFPELLATRSASALLPDFVPLLVVPVLFLLPPVLQVVSDLHLTGQKINSFQQQIFQTNAGSALAGALPSPRETT